MFFLCVLGGRVSVVVRRGRLAILESPDKNSGEITWKFFGNSNLAYSVRLFTVMLRGYLGFCCPI